MELVDRLVESGYARREVEGAWQLIPEGEDLPEWEDGFWILPAGQVVWQAWDPADRRDKMQLIGKLNSRELAKALSRIPVWADPQERML